MNCPFCNTELRVDKYGNSFYLDCTKYNPFHYWMNYSKDNHNITHYANLSFCVMSYSLDDNFIRVTKSNYKGKSSIYENASFEYFVSLRNKMSKLKAFL